jgi:hypothetical protein
MVTRNIAISEFSLSLEEHFMYVYRDADVPKSVK